MPSQKRPPTFSGSKSKRKRATSPSVGGKGVADKGIAQIIAGSRDLQASTLTLRRKGITAIHEVLTTTSTRRAINSYYQKTHLATALGFVYPPDPKHQEPNIIGKAYDLAVSALQNHVTSCINKGLKKSTHEDISLSKILSSVDADHLSAYQANSHKSTSPPTLLSPFPSHQKATNPPSFSPLTPKTLSPSTHVYPVTYLTDETLRKVLDHCIVTLTDDTYVKSHPNLYSDCHSCLHHLFSLPCLTLGLKPSAIEPVYSALTQYKVEISKTQVAKLLKMILAIDSSYNRLPVSHLPILIPHFLTTLSECKKNLQTHENETIIILTFRSLSSLLSSSLCIPTKSIANLLQTVSLALRVYPRTDQNGIDAILSFLSSLARHCTPTTTKNIVTISRTIIETVTQRRWEEGKRRKLKIETLYTSTVSLYLDLYMTNREICSRTLTSDRFSTYILSPAPPLADDILTTFLSSTSLPSSHQHWATLSALFALSSPPPSYINFELVHQLIKKYVTSPLLLTNDLITPYVTAILLKLIPSLPLASLYDYLVPLLSSNEHPHLLSAKPAILIALAKYAKIDVGNIYGVGHVVTFTDVNLLLPNSATVTRRHQIVTELSTNVASRFSEMKSDPSPSNFEEIFLEVKNLCADSYSILHGKPVDEMMLSLLFNCSLFPPPASSPAPESSDSTNVIGELMSRQLCGVFDSHLPSSPPQSPVPFLLFTIIKLSTTSTSSEVVSDLVSAAISTYNTAVPFLSQCRTTFMRSSTLLRNILAYTAHINMSSSPLTNPPNCKRLYELCCKVIKGFIFNPCPAAPGNATKANEDDPWDADDTSNYRKKATSLTNDSDMDTQGSNSQRGSAFEDSDSDFDDYLPQNPTNFMQNMNKRQKSNFNSSQLSSNVSNIKNDSDSFLYPDSQGALIIAAILAILSPTKTMLKIIADSFAWPEETYQELHKKQLDVQLYFLASPSEIVSCVTLFTTPAAILSEYRLPESSSDNDNDNNDNEDSDDDIESKITVPYLLCSMLMKARELSPASSPFHGCGYDLVTKLVTIAKSTILEEDVNDIMALAVTKNKSLRKSIRSRDGLRAKQLECLTAIFMHSEGELKKECEKVFTHQLLKSVTDTSEQVRKVAIDALGVAFSLRAPDSQLDMFDSLLNALPPLSKDPKLVVEQWENFAKNLTPKSEHELEAIMDIRTSMESTSIASIAQAVASTPNVLVARKGFFKLIELAAVRDDLTAPIATACFSMSKSCGFPSLTDMINDDIEYILSQWLTTSLSIENLPLLLCDPAAQEELLRCGITSVFNYSPGDEGENFSAHSSPPSSPILFTQLPPSDTRTITLDIMQLHIDAIFSFLHRNSPTLLPLILSIMSKSQVEDEDMEDSGHRKGFSGESYSESLNSSKKNDGFLRLSECCALLMGSSSDDAIASWLKLYVQNILSVVFPLIYNETDPKKTNEGRHLLNKLVGCMSEQAMNKQLQKVTHKIILGVLKNLSSRCFEDDSGSRTLGDEAFFQAIQRVARAKAGEREPVFTHSVFHVAGSSVAEVLINLKDWFDKSHNLGEQERLINTLRHVIRVIVEESEEKKEATGLGMAIQVILALLIEKKLSTYRVEILNMLGFLVTVCLNDKEEASNKRKSKSAAKKKSSSRGSNRTHLYRMLNKTVQTLVDCYETAVRRGKKVEDEEKAKERIESIESLGLLGLNNGGEGAGVWGWDSLSSVVGNRNVVETLISKTNEEERVVKEGCLKLLNDILIKSDSSMDEELQNLDPIPPCEALSMDDDLSTLLSNFLKRKGTKNDEATCYHHLKRFINFCVRYSREREMKAKQQGAKSVKVMLDLVVSAFQSLNETHGGGGKFLSTSAHYPLFYNVLKQLSKLCKEENDSSIKSAAASVLGNISHFNWAVLVQGEGATASMEKYELGKEGEFLNAEGEDGDEKHDAMLGLKMKILKHLGYSILTDRAETAIIAMDTAKKILFTRAGAHAMNLLSDDDPTKEILVAICSITDKPSDKTHHGVDDAFLKKLWGKGKNVNCWEKSMWTCDSPGSEAYEDWIKKLITSIILVYYWEYEGRKRRKKKNKIVMSMVGEGEDGILNDEGQEKIEDLDEMLKLCAEMTCKDSGFAEVVFPAIVLDLLEKGGEGRGEGRGEWMIGNTGDSFINRKLTQGFGCLIGGEMKNVDAITVAVEIFDFLRVITKRGFLEWGGHRKCITSLKGKIYPDATGKDRRRSRTPDHSDTHNKDLGPVVEWKGIPFGVVLRLDGLSVARACLKAKRPCSALMFLETYCDNVFEGSSECLKGSGERGRGLGDVSGFGEREGEEREGAKERIENRRTLKTVFQQAYDLLGEDDAVIGVENSTIDLDFEVEESGDMGGISDVSFFTDPWKKVQDADMKLQGGTDVWAWKVSLGEGLNELGLNHVGSGYLDGLRGIGGAVGEVGEDFKRLQEMWHEGAWRSMTWGGEAGFGVGVRGGGESFHANLHGALCNVLQNDREAFGKSVKDGMKGLAEIVGSTADGEGMMRTFLQNGLKLWSLEEVERMGRGLTEGDGSDVGRLVEEWSVGKGEEELDFVKRMFIDDVREVGTRIVMKRAGSSTGETEKDYAPSLFRGLQRRLGEAMRGGWVKEARGILGRLKNLAAGEGEAAKRTGLGFLELKLLEAELLWEDGDFMGAIRLGKLVVEKGQIRGEIGGDNKFLARALLKCGKWMATSKTDGAKVVLEKYLKPSVLLSRSNEGTDEETSESHLVLAEFLADLLELVETRMNSLEWKKAGKKAQERNDEFEEVSALYETRTTHFKTLQKQKCQNAAHKLEVAAKEKEMNATRRYMVGLQKELKIDNKERKAVEGSRTDFTKLSLQNYVHGLSLDGREGGQGGGGAKHIFRFISVWLKNADKEGINKIAGKAAERVPSYLFVPLIYQLFSRVGSGVKDFRSALNSLILRICSDHPHHGIVQLLTLSNGTHTEGVSKGAQNFLANVEGGKSATAGELIQELKKMGRGGELTLLIESMESLCDAYVNLAMANTTKWHGSKQKDIQLAAIYKRDQDPLHLCLGRGRWCDGRGGGAKILPAVLTKPPNVQKDNDYSLLTGSDLLVGFETTFQLTNTGLHRPKIVKALGETGKKYKQLVKGDDDIRQDAVVQLVFGLVNRLLWDKKDLRITTYSVVPLSPMSGVLEWVLNTEPFGEFLLDSGPRIGAHSRYFPGCWGGNLCRNHLRHAPIGQKPAAFQEIMKRFPPAFRFFFQERFGHSLPAWFGARQNFTRSCAASSIVGHILGIGDRHCHNILISNKTGNVVHIDFGIVFEQGKVLTTPETIPFRLTRDIVDGMGVTGVEGVFHKSCCEVLRVMRENSGTLLTVLDVITNDPMYSFLMSPLQKQKIQAEGRDQEEDGEDGGGEGENSEEIEGMGKMGTAEQDEDSNDAAARVLAKIASKLRGFEDNTVEQLSIDGQVLLLINEARSIENLSRLYFGWQPWV